jgi:hypothetical protein
MFAKILLTWAALVICLTAQAESQYDPLGTEIFTKPNDMRRTASLDDQKVYSNPDADPLGIDPLMRPLDTEHTWEYLDKVNSKAYADAYAQTEADLRGDWRLVLRDSELRHLDMMMLQNREVIYGRGTMDIGSVSQKVSISGTTSKDVLYLDVLSDDLTLYRCRLTIAKDYLSGRYYAFDSAGRAWRGLVQGNKIP